MQGDGILVFSTGLPASPVSNGSVYTVVGIQRRQFDELGSGSHGMTPLVDGSNFNTLYISSSTGIPEFANISPRAMTLTSMAVTIDNLGSSFSNPNDFPIGDFGAVVLLEDSPGTDKYDFSSLRCTFNRTSNIRTKTVMGSTTGSVSVASGQRFIVALCWANASSNLIFTANCTASYTGASVSLTYE